jgi:ABC-type antimicrobial peptide transport system ATPase subunit
MKKPSFRARWLNRRIWRWRRNRLKHRLHLLSSKRFREEMREYDEWLAEERAEVQVLIDSLDEDG